MLAYDHQSNEFDDMCSGRRSAHEHPEQAYRRGYQQGAWAVFEMLDKRGPPTIDSTFLRRLRLFILVTLYDWRYSRRARKREIVRDQPPQFF